MHPLTMEPFPNPHLPRNLWLKLESKLNQFEYNPLIIASNDSKFLYAVNKQLLTNRIWKLTHLKTWNEIKIKVNALQKSITITTIIEIDNKLYCFTHKNHILMINTTDGTIHNIYIKESIYDKIVKITAALAIKDTIHIITINESLQVTLQQQHNIKHLIIDTKGNILQLRILQTINNYTVNYNYKTLLIKMEQDNLCM